MYFIYKQILVLTVLGSKMSFNFVSFSLRDSESCNEDYVEIRLHSESGPLLKLYCGNNVTSTIIANSTLWIKFRSSDFDSTESPQGFSADFTLGNYKSLRFTF